MSGTIFSVTQYLYIDKLLDSSLPYNLIQEYSHQRSQSNGHLNTISEEQPPTPVDPFSETPIARRSLSY